MAGLHCVLSSPRGVVYEGEATSVVVPATDGELGILVRHAPLLASLGSGELRVSVASPGGEAGRGGTSGKRRFFVEGGFVQVLQNRVSILTSTAEPLESLSKDSAEAELESLLRDRPKPGSSDKEYSAYDDRVRKARVRVKLAGG